MITYDNTNHQLLKCFWHGYVTHLTEGSSEFKQMYTNLPKVEMNVSNNYLTYTYFESLPWQHEFQRKKSREDCQGKQIVWIGQRGHQSRFLTTVITTLGAWQMLGRGLSALRCGEVLAFLRHMTMMCNCKLLCQFSQFLFL